jgi:hypothetical protein
VQDFEEGWLDEGLAHIAEELLFYREAGLAPRQNLKYSSLVASTRIRNAYLADMNGNAARYRDYLSAPGTSSPYRTGDSLATRGAAWSLLRYLADRAASSDGDIWSRLVNNTAVGTANLQSVFGEIAPLVRDWAASNAVDDSPATSSDLSQKSWNWRSVYGGVDAIAALYPLALTGMSPATPSYSGTVVAGGSAFYTFTVPASGTATLTLNGATPNFQLVIVRTR